MAVKFENILKSFFPKGQIWIFQTNFIDLITGMSIEFLRAYDSAKEFYINFNIINSEVLAIEHGRDYLLNTDLYTNAEIQRIIVEYINKDLGLKDIIEDFATYIGHPITWDSAEIMILEITFISSIDCEYFNKIRFLANYFKPPYLQIIYINSPAIEDPFIFGDSTFGSTFGGTLVCQ